MNSVNYYKSVWRRRWGTRPKVKDSYRLFMAPGMSHCQGGEGPSNFDMLTALEQWVEQGKAPDRIVASHMTGRQGGPDAVRCARILQVAVYQRKGEYR